MTYQPSYELFGRWAKPQVTAIIPASGMAALIGTAGFVLLTLLFEPILHIPTLGELFSFLVMGGVATVFAAISALFVTAFFISLLGLPIALVMGETIRKPIALPVAMGVAAAGALFVAWRFSGGETDYFADERMLPFLLFALPAGYFYRRFIIAAMDAQEPE